MRPSGSSVLMLSMLAVTACEKPQAAVAHDGVPTSHEVTVIARNYAYQMPDTLASGLTRFHLINSGDRAASPDVLPAR